MSTDWTQNDQNLRNVLARLYRRDADITRLLEDPSVKIDPAFTAWDERPVNTWHGIVKKAKAAGKLGKIIAFARAENPDVQALALAEQGLLLSREAQIPEGVWQPTDSLHLEKLMKRVSSLRSITFLEEGLVAARSVARIVFANGENGSGFLTKDNLLITNHHVIPSEDEARKAKAQFNYQKTLEGRMAPLFEYDLVPDKGWATSPKEEPHGGGGDDWSAVRVDGNPNAKFGFLPLNRASPKAEEEVIIIQHPDGGPKQIALSHNLLTAVTDRRLQYLVDTLEGSSGSPVFDTRWQVIGLHYAGDWMSDLVSGQAVYRNAGIHINLVIDGLAKEGLL